MHASFDATIMLNAGSSQALIPLIATRLVHCLKFTQCTGTPKEAVQSKPCHLLSSVKRFSFLQCPDFPEFNAATPLFVNYTAEGYVGPVRSQVIIRHLVVAQCVAIEAESLRSSDPELKHF